MTKIIMIFLTMELSAFAMSFQTFKEQTLQHSKLLQSQQLSTQITATDNAILLRTKNPQLSLEASRFDENLKGSHTGSSFGYSISASQNIRTRSYMDGIQDQVNATTLLQKAYITQGYAGYLKTLEILYTDYVYQGKMLALMKEEYLLSVKVTGMVKERFKNGSDNRVSYLQAKTETLALKTQTFTTKQAVHKLYYQLLALASLKKNITLEKKFIYPISTQVAQTSTLSPAQHVLQAKEKIYQSQMHMHQSSFQSYDVYAAVEDEPDQSILRLGVNIPLSIHNDRSEERALAKLQTQQVKLDQEQLSLDTQREKEFLKSSIKELHLQYNALQLLQYDQEVLTTLLQEGYEIAQGSLFQLMNAKNKRIQTKKQLLQTHKNINEAQIALRFLQGYYNE